MVQIVDDHGLECIRKSTEEIIPGDKTYYRLRTLSSGTFRVQSLTTSNPTDQYEVDDTNTAFPLIGPTDSNVNGFTVYNKGETNSVFISTDPSFRAGWSHNTTDGGTEIGPGESLNLPCDSGLRIYAKCESGKKTQVTFTQWI